MQKDLRMKKLEKKKETNVEKFLIKEIELPFYKRDEVVDGDCSNYRPDFVYHLGSHVLIIEVDEHQHKSYKSCAGEDDLEGRMRTEERRMMMIFQSFEGLPVTFIRYNPDGYMGDKVDESKRKEVLIGWVRKLIIEKPEEGCFVKYLFYNGYKQSDVSMQKF